MSATTLVRRRARVANTPLHVSGLALAFLSVGMFASTLVELVDGGPDAGRLALSGVLVGGLGTAAWRLTKVPAQVTGASAFAAVAWTWVLASVAGAVPYLLVGIFDHPDDAVFEAISGFTTTGASVLAPIEGNGAGILFWRNLTQWYGGMGMVVLAVAVLPFLGVGGLDLISAEAPGPHSDRLTPRVAETARRLWTVYGLFTLLVALALLAVGLSLYDAVVHAFTTLSTGGFSPYDASIAHFDSVAVEAVLIIGMLAAGANFSLHYRAVRGNLGAYGRVSEFRTYAMVTAAAVAFLVALNLADGFLLSRALRESAFSVVSIVTTTGFGTADFSVWVPAAQMVLLFLMLSGAMTGSTSGGAKLLRIQVLLQYAMREVRRARHPRGVFAVKLGDSAVPEPIVGRITGFLILFVVVYLVGFIVVAALGSDLVTAMSGAASALGNIGPALGEAGPAANFLVFTRPARMVLALLMLLGRLEIFPMLLMFAAVSRSRARRRQIARGRHLARRDH